MAVAENRACFWQHGLQQKLSDAANRQCPVDAGYYSSMTGRAELKLQFAALAQREMCANRAAVRPSQLVISSGCGALINQLAHLLAAEGECVLLPTPTYASLYNDFSVVAACTVVDVPLVCDARGAPVLSEAQLDASLAAAPARVRILFLINPSNPIGRVHSRDELAMAVRWCRRHGIHLIVDEIYALSVHRPELDHAFVSVAVVCAEMHQASAVDDASAAASATDIAATVSVNSAASVDTAAVTSISPSIDDYLGDHVHILWGFSKDWCASGLRVGVLNTHNRALLEALGNVNYFSAVANDTQETLAAICADAAWTSTFFAANRASLRATVELIEGDLRAANIPFVAPSAGMFVWLDLRAFLPAARDGDSHAFARERELTRVLFAQLRVLLTPGEACHAAEPGFYRCCFAWMQDVASVREGIRRLANWAASER